MLELNKLHPGDCLNVMKKIDNESIQLILCDLPYETTEFKWDKIIPFDKLWFQYERILAKNGTAVLTAAQPFTSNMIMSNLKMFKYSMVMEKKSPFGHMNAKCRPLIAHEDIAIFSKGTMANGSKNKMIYNPQNLKKVHIVEKNAIKSAKRSRYALSWKNQKNNYVQTQSNYPRSVIKVNNTDKSNIKHPTQKSVAVFEYLIRTFSNENDIVLDNCAGSGTTGIAALKNNRQFILIEKEREYIDLIQRRLDAFYNK